MTWQRICGAALLFAAGGLWAAGRTRRERAEAARVAALGQLLARIGGQIDALCLPLTEILSGLPPALAHACAVEERTVAGLLAAMEGVSDPTARESLGQVTAALGRGSREEQIRLCRAAAGALEDRQRVMAREAEKNARARAVTVLTAAAGAVIVLW